MDRLLRFRSLNNCLYLINKIISFAGGPNSLQVVQIRAKPTQCKVELNQQKPILKRDRRGQRTPQQGPKDPKPTIENRSGIQGPQLAKQIYYIAVVFLMCWNVFKIIFSNGQSFFNNNATVMCFIPNFGQEDDLY